MSTVSATVGRTAYYGNEVRPLVTSTHSQRGDIIEIDIRKPGEERVARANFFRAIHDATYKAGIEHELDISLLRAELADAEKHGFATLIILAPEGYPPTVQLSKTRNVPHSWDFFHEA